MTDMMFFDDVHKVILAHDGFFIEFDEKEREFFSAIVRKIEFRSMKFKITASYVLTDIIVTTMRLESDSLL